MATNPIRDLLRSAALAAAVIAAGTATALADPPGYYFQESPPPTYQARQAAPPARDAAAPGRRDMPMAAAQVGDGSDPAPTSNGLPLRTAHAR